jgi:tetratricopeptide (TPR) repeat protein
VDEQGAVQAFREWSTSYPRDYKAVSNLGSFYGDVCRYPEAIAQFELARGMNPADVVSHEDLMEMLIAVGEFKKARAVYQDILRLHLDDDSPHLYLYVIAALENNSAEMATQSAWFEDKKELQHEILSEQADAAALSGNLGQARAVRSALSASLLLLSHAFSRPACRGLSAARGEGARGGAVADGAAQSRHRAAQRHGALCPAPTGPERRPQRRHRLKAGFVRRFSAP